MIGVQAKGANPVVRAYEQKRRDFDVLAKPTTVASAICVGDPLDGKKILKAIYDSGGMAVDVEMRRYLMRRSFLRDSSLFL